MEEEEEGRRREASSHHSSCMEGNIIIMNNSSNNNNNNNNNNIDVSMCSYERCYCYYLMEAMPQPGPTWSTTDPCVIMADSSSSSSSSAITIEDYNNNDINNKKKKNQDSSCSSSWWMGLLDGLDGKNMNIIDDNDDDDDDEILLDYCYPFVDNNNNSCKDGICYESQSLVDAIDLSCCYPDDGLMLPTMDNDLGEIFQP